MPRREAPSRPVEDTTLKQPTIKVGDSVRYRGDFLRSIGAYSGPLGWARRTVTQLQTIGADVILAAVAWDNPDMPAKVNVKNLERTRKAR